MLRAPSAETCEIERGASLIMTTIVMMILAMLSVAVLGRTLSVLTSVRSGQDFEAALAVADLGLSDAMFKIDQSAPADWSATGAAGGGTFHYTADKISDAEYIVRSKGSIGGSNHGVAARITRTARFPYALFTNQNLELDGRVGASNFYTFTVGGGVGDGPVYAGANGTSTCNGNSFSTQLTVQSFGGNKDCPNHVFLDNEEPMPAVQEPLAPTQPCPTDGIFTGAINGMSGRPFVCRQDVILAGTVSSAGSPVIIYVLDSIAGDGSVVHHSVDMRDSVVNVGVPSVDFQLFKQGPAPIHIDHANTSDRQTFSGVLYAPDTTLTINGGKWWTGSVMLNELKVNGGPNLIIGYDLALSTYYGDDWTLSRYTEIPSSEVGLS